MNNIIKIADKIKENVRTNILDIFAALDEDYDVEIFISQEEIDLIINEFFDYYESKEIIYAFSTNMINHFNDLAITALENNIDSINLSYVLESLKLFELLESETEVDPTETNKIITKIKNGSEDRKCNNEG
jgi:hypothetical protein